MTERVERESGRLLAIDVVRGFVMVLMTLDHSSSAFYAKRVLTDGAAVFPLDTVFEPLPFVTRWVTHLCAPTFILLAGVSLALSVTRRRRAGIDGSLIDRDLLIRGALLIALDTVWMGWIWRLGMPLQLGPVYAVGASMIGMILLRRLPPLVVGALGVAIMVGGEAVNSMLDPTTTLTAASMAGGQVGPIYWLYPFLPWAGFLMVGWAIGMRLAEPHPERGGLGMRVRDWLTLSGVAAVTFAVVRGLNGYGNAHLLRRDGPWTGWIEWLHVSKYPPSLAYAGLELAITFALLAAAWRWARPWKPLVVLGQTALFFYLLHVHVLKSAALALGLYRTEGLGVVYVVWLITLAALYPACRWYLRLKRRYPDSVLRYV
jgi:uncharacterized membrane protein